MRWKHLVVNMDSCPSCGKSFVGQLRHVRLGLDEAPILVKCVCTSEQEELDLTISFSESRSCVGYSRDPVGLPDQPIVDSGFTIDPAVVTDTTVEHEIRIEPHTSREMYMSIKADSHTWTEFGRPVTMEVEGRLYSARLRIRSDELPTIKSTMSRYDLCAGMVYALSLESYLKPGELPGAKSPRRLDQSYHVLVRSKVVHHYDWTMRCNWYPADDSYAAELELNGGATPTKLRIIRALVWIHSNFGHVSSMDRYLDASMVSSCRVGMSPVLDVLTPTEESSIYRPKADGETVWVVSSHSMWYVCRVDPGLRVVSWQPFSDIAPESSKTTIIRAELMVDGSLVYIDTLAIDGVASAPVRHYVPPLVELATIPWRPRLIVRNDLSTMDDAEASRASLDIATDGILAIERSTSSTYRIKPPTADLVCRGRFLHSTPSARDLRFESMPGMVRGRVYECGLALREGRITIESFFPRPDKHKGNRPEIVGDAVQRALGTLSDEKVVVRKVIQASFMVREHLYDQASNLTTTGSLVVDVGSGRMQSKQAMERSGCTYLLCDPQLSVKSLGGKNVRRPMDVTLMDGTSIVNVMKQLSRGRIRVAMYKGTIEDLLGHPEVLDHIRTQSIPLVYSFSVSRAHTMFRRLAELGVPQVGSCFLYDGCMPGQFLVDESGIRMGIEIARHDVAFVEFPPEARYEEPSVTSRDLGPTSICRYGYEVLWQLDALEPRVRRVTDKMFIVSSSRV